jgi:ADP-dependent NAD(P)H-hydrate dehydratase / NAD(P)H-hydrate epimerase
MLKILTSQQVKDLDAHTIAHEPIASIDLMERACRAFVSWFTPRFDTSLKIGIVCGTGNNGGDGLGIARLLNDLGYTIHVWIVRGSVSETDDFKKNLERLVGKVKIDEISSSSDQGLFINVHVLIDAVFGSGISRPLDGIYAQVVNCINQTDAVRLAVDIPSGLLTNMHLEGVAVRADYTISFQLPKLTFLLPENSEYTGEWHIVNIGLDKTFIEKADTSLFFTERKDVKRIIKKRTRFSHKGTYGKALIISGSYGKMGAAVLASRAAMHSGLGLLTSHIPKCGYVIIQTSIPEAMASIDDHETVFSSLPSLDGYDAIGIGPGIGTEQQTVAAFTRLLQQMQKPIVIDADGLNILSSNRELLHLIPPNSILTPHPKEFERLAGSWKHDFERLELQREFAVKTKTVVILKGAFSSIATPQGHIYFNPTGNPGMATGGSGDVLTGLLTGLLAQQYSSEQTALLGVYLHGLAGDFAANNKGMSSMIASDIIESFSEAFKSLNS